LIPQVRNGALVCAITTPAIDHLVAAVIEMLVPVRKGVANAAGCKGLGLFLRTHGFAIVAGVQPPAKGEMALYDLKQSSGAIIAIA
jgi:hypothetical protein